MIAQSELQMKKLNDAISGQWNAIRHSNMHKMSYGSVAYDTAWAARIQSDRRPVFPTTLHWLLDNQHEDGSWGSYGDIFFDQLLSTLTTTKTLAMYSRGEDIFSEKIERATHWVGEHIAQLKNFDPTLSGIGFGVLLPPQLVEFEKITGYDFGGEYLMSRWNKKLEHLDFDDVLGQHSHLAWSLEFLDGLEYSKDLPERQLSANGSIVNSNAPTAWYILQDGQHKNWALYYLQGEIRTDGSISQFSRLDAFNRLWQQHSIMEAAGFVPPVFHRDFIQLKSRLRPDGITMGEYFPFADSDDSNFVLMMLHKLNLIKADSRYMDFYQFYEVHDDWFENYVGRHGKSTSRAIDGQTNDRFTYSVNLHFYEVYSYFDQVKSTEHTRYVLDKLDWGFSQYFSEYDHFPHDRWHSSPFYSNSHAIYAFKDRRPEWSEKCMSYLLDEMDDEGYYGSEKTRTELSAFAVGGLAHYHNHVEKIDLELLGPSVEWLVEHPGNNINLWVSKTLYDPDFFDGIVLGALLEYRKAMGFESFSFLL